MLNKKLRLYCYIKGAARCNNEKDTGTLDAKLKDKVKLKSNRTRQIKMVKENPSQISMIQGFFDLRI